jgi:hypothetical protein
MSRNQADGTNRTRTAESPAVSGRIRRRHLLRNVGASAVAATVGAGLVTPAAARKQTQTGHLRVSVPGRSAAVAGNIDAQSLPHEIEIRAETEEVQYTFTVSGDVEMGGSAGDFDEIVDGNTVNGRINQPYPQGRDNYFFSGEITSFTVSTGRAQVLVNGEDITDRLGEQAPPAQPEAAAECVEFSPISYQGQSAEDFYGYRPDIDAENPRQSNTPAGLERPGVSRLFLFPGPEGLCLFIIHGGGEGEQGGAASFRISGLPESGEWVVLDDSYDGATDIFDLDGDLAELHWAWGVEGRNDGAVFCGLGEQFSVRIEPAFNEAARLDPFGPGQVDRWQLLSGSATDPQAVNLPLDRPGDLESDGC